MLARKIKQIIGSITTLIQLTAEVTYALLMGNQKRKIQNLGTHKSLYIFLTGNGFDKEKTRALLENRENHQVLAVNSFCKTPLFTQTKPDIYAINDPIFFSDQTEKVTARLDHAKALGEQTSWPMTLIVPTYARQSQFIDEITKNQNINIHYIALAPLTVNTSVSRRLYLLGYGIPRPSNVLVWTLAISLWLNVDTIHLMGASFDFYKDFQISDDGDIIKLRDGKKELHYHTRNETGPYKPSMAEALEYIAHAYYSLYMIEEAANTIGVTIKNTTQNSMLDCFKK